MRDHIKSGIIIHVVGYMFYEGFINQYLDAYELKIMKIKQEIAVQIGKTVGKTIDFWQGKSPCWEMCHCPEDIKGQCPASKNTFLPCWEIEGTYLKLSDDGIRGDDLSICQVCRVYKRYGQGKPIEIKLKGKGLDTYCRNLQKKYQVK